LSSFQFQHLPHAVSITALCEKMETRFEWYLIKVLGRGRLSSERVRLEWEIQPGWFLSGLQRGQDSHCPLGWMLGQRSWCRSYRLVPSPDVILIKSVFSVCTRPRNRFGSKHVWWLGTYLLEYQ